MKYAIFYILLLLYTEAYSQENRILSIDLRTKIVDTLEIAEYDKNIKNENTKYNTGLLNSNYCNLKTTIPTENVWNNTNFTKRKQASIDYDINCFPIRTGVKLFKMVNDTLLSQCSGVMVSKKHVLTAAHCIFNMKDNRLLYDSVFICPVYDNGFFNPNFQCSWVRKVYFFENWNLSQTDFAILELEDPVGEGTGWVSIGFNSDDTSLLDGIYYKFSYPAVTILQLDSNYYNGDTMYYNYGVVDLVEEHYLGILRTNGLPGESGSPLMKVQNENYYTTYAVLTFGVSLRHNRLTNWKYFGLKSVIANYTELGITEEFQDSQIMIFPNPTSNSLSIVNSDREIIKRIDLFDLSGKKIFERYFYANEIKLEFSGILEGVYILIAYTDNKIIVRKVSKIE